jgi:outer membrane receptor protein involved in Fe transport
MTFDLKTWLALALLAAPAPAVQGAEVFPADLQHFDIPAQSTSDALNTFSRQSGLRLLFPYDALEGRHAGAVKGEFSAEEVLKRLLAGTGLGYRMTDEAVVLISPPGLSTREAPRATGADAGPRQGARGAAAAQQDRSAAGKLELALAEEQRQEARSAPPPRQSTAAEEAKPGELTVTGTRIRGAADVAAPGMTITREDIEQTGYATLEGLFEDLPQNFSEITPDGALAFEGASRLRSANLDRATGVDLRGLGPQSTLTLVNGQRRAGTVGGRVVDVSVIPLSMIERVEVVTGGRSAVYGSDAVAGVVNLVTRKAFQGAESQASYGWNRYGGERLQFSQIAGTDFSRGGIVGAYDFLLEWPLNIVDTGLVIVPSLEGTEATRLDVQVDSERHSFFTAGHYALTDGIELYADGLFADKKFEFVNEYVYLLPGAGDSFSIIDQTGEQYSASAGVRIDLGSNWTVDLGGTLGVADTSTHALSLADFGFFVSESDQSSDSRSRTSSASAVADGPVPFFGAITPRAAVGLEMREERFENVPANPVVSLDDKGRSVDAVFAEVLIPWIENGARPGLRRLETSIAGRYDDYSDFGGGATPQLGVLWSPVEGVLFRSAYSEAYRAPALVELGTQARLQLSLRTDPAVPGGNSPLLALEGDNPNLTPEEARTWSVGVDFEPAFAPFARVSVSYFNIEYEGRIDVPAFNTTDRILVLQRESRFVDLITRNPTQAEVDAYFALHTAGAIFNFTGQPWNQATTPILTAFPTLVLFDNRLNNIAIETVDGLDLQLRTDFDTALGAVNLGINATYSLNHERSVTATSPAFSLLNEVGKPVDLRVRAQAGWRRGAFGAYCYFNYVDRYANPFATPVTPMKSWLTADLTLRFDGSALAAGGSWLDGFNATLSVSNLFDREPPEYLNSQIGLRYDAINASGTGRYLTLRLVKNW